METPLPVRFLPRFKTYQYKERNKYDCLRDNINESIACRVRIKINPKSIQRNKYDEDSENEPSLPGRWSPAPALELSLKPVPFLIIF